MYSQCVLTFRIFVLTPRNCLRRRSRRSLPCRPLAARPRALRVCVCARALCVRARTRVCACACACVNTYTYKHTNIYTCIQIYIHYMYIYFMCTCVIYVHLLCVQLCIHPWYEHLWMHVPWQVARACRQTWWLSRPDRQVWYRKRRRTLTPKWPPASRWGHHTSPRSTQTCAQPALRWADF